MEPVYNLQARRYLEHLNLNRVLVIRRLKFHNLTLGWETGILILFVSLEIVTMKVTPVWQERCQSIEMECSVSSMVTYLLM